MKKLLLLIILLFGFVSTNTQIVDFSSNGDLYLQHLEKSRYERTRTLIIEAIKIHEAFSPTKYHTGAVTDSKTTGYGHKIKPGEYIPDTISEEFADSLLRADFEGAQYYAEFYTPMLKKPENKYKSLAIAHFVFAKGIGNWNKSKLKIYAEHDEMCMDLFEEEIVKWIIVRFPSKTNPDEEYVRHDKRMLKNRLLELEIYKMVSYI